MRIQAANRSARNGGNPPVETSGKGDEAGAAPGDESDSSYETATATVISCALNAIKPPGIGGPLLLKSGRGLDKR